MNNYKLIKVKEGYIIVSDEDTKEGDKIIYKKLFNTIGTAGEDNLDKKYFAKIIASTFIPELPDIDFNGLEEEFGIVDIEKLTFDIYPEIIKERWYEEGLAYEEDIHEENREGFVEGFNKCLELNKDKLYTEEDLRNAHMTGSISSLNWNNAGIEETYNHFDKAESYIQSLQPKTEWDIEVEIENNCWCMKPVNDGYIECAKKPKITNNKIKILKIK